MNATKYAVAVGQVWRDRFGTTWRVENLEDAGASLAQSKPGVPKDDPNRVTVNATWDFFDNATLVIKTDGTEVPPIAPKPTGFSPGDVVLLRSGGAKMTVTSVTAAGWAWCSWHSADLLPIKECYPVELLQHDDPDNWVPR